MWNISSVPMLAWQRYIWVYKCTGCTCRANCTYKQAVEIRKPCSCGRSKTSSDKRNYCNNDDVGRRCSRCPCLRAKEKCSVLCKYQPFNFKNPKGKDEKEKKKEKNTLTSKDIQRRYNRKSSELFLRDQGSHLPHANGTQKKICSSLSSWGWLHVTAYLILSQQIFSIYSKHLMTSAMIRSGWESERKTKISWKLN